MLVRWRGWTAVLYPWKLIRARFVLDSRPPRVLPIEFSNDCSAHRGGLGWLSDERIR